MSQGRQVKSEAELREMIVSEFRKYPACKHVLNVGFTRPLNRNWDVTYLNDGPKAGRGDQFVGPFVRSLQAKYDLA
jgi:hypothetical protein